MSSKHVLVSRPMSTPKENESSKKIIFCRELEINTGRTIANIIKKEGGEVGGSVKSWAGTQGLTNFLWNKN